jgi:hypothetical protein
MTPCPDRHDDVVFEAAFAAFWPKLWKYLKTQSDITENTEQDWKDSAHKILKRNYTEDGYQLAKDFEDGHWSVDADFVELADGWGHELYTAHQKLKEQWVIDNGVKPLMRAGTKVKVQGRWISDRLQKIPKEVYDGEIIRADPKRGEYHVFVAEAGHVRPGTGNGVTGIMVPFADLERMNQDEADGQAAMAALKSGEPVHEFTVADEDDQIGRTCDDA